MITLISTWKLKNGAPPELVKALQSVAEQVKKAEPDTLLYSVHLQARSPLDAHRQPLDPPPKPIPADEQTAVVFFEIYRDADAFAYHVNGPTFTQFREANIQYFDEDPQNPGWPQTETPFLDRQSAFIRPDAG